MKIRNGVEVQPMKNIEKLTFLVAWAPALVTPRSGMFLEISSRSWESPSGLVIFWHLSGKIKYIEFWQKMTKTGFLAENDKYI